MGRRLKNRPEYLEMKLLSPLTGAFYLKDSRGKIRYDDSAKDLDGKELAQYEDAIRRAMDKMNGPDSMGDTSGDFMEDRFWGSASVWEKVRHALVSIENVEGTLYGCTTLQIVEPLESWELEEMCKYVAVQYCDGWGECFEQRNIKVEGGILNVFFSLYPDEKFQIQGAEVKKPEPEAPDKKPKKGKNRKDPCR